MNEFANSPDALLSYFSASLAILFAASYVAMVVRSCIKSLTRMRMMSYAAYTGLVFSAITLAFAAKLFDDGFWFSVLLFALAGILVAPHALKYLGGCKPDAEKSASSLRMSH